MDYKVQELSKDEGHYWSVKRYCFHCRKIKQFIKCDNCGKFFCPTCSGCFQGPELGDYGSIISPAYIAHTKC